VKGVHAKRITLAQAHDALRVVRDLTRLPNWQIHYSDLHWRHEEVAEWAMATSLSFYDAIYLFVAEKVGAVFWTADRKLYEFLRQNSNPRAQWIGNYQPFSQ
jgi:predicted nucleic acid-binding protein